MGATLANELQKDFYLRGEKIFLQFWTNEG